MTKAFLRLIVVLGAVALGLYAGPTTITDNVSAIGGVVGDGHIKKMTVVVPAPFTANDGVPVPAQTIPVTVDPKTGAFTVQLEPNDGTSGIYVVTYKSLTNTYTEKLTVPTAFGPIILAQARVQGAAISALSGENYLMPYKVLTFVPENTMAKGIPNGYAPLGANGLIPDQFLPVGNATVPVWGNITGTLSAQTDLTAALAGKASSTDNRFLNATSLNGTSIASFAGIPFFTTGTPRVAHASDFAALFTGCTGGATLLSSTGNCVAPSAGSTAATWGSITGTLTSQTDLAAALAGKQSVLGYTAENTANKGTANGYAPLDATSKVPAANLPAVVAPAWGGITGTLSNQTDISTALSGKQTALGFTPENSANRGSANGYAPLDANSKVPAANLPANSAAAWGAIIGTLSDQSDLSAVLAAKQSNLGFTPENVTKKGVANGYAPLDASSKVPAANLPTATPPTWGGIAGSISNQTDLYTQLTNLSTSISGKQNAIGYTPENAANRGAVNGYAPLGADSKVPAANLPATSTPTWGAIGGTLSDQTDLSTALAAKQNALGFTAENIAKKGAANGYAPLGADAKVPALNLPALTWGSLSGTLADQTDLAGALASKQNALSYTPENAANRGSANGYAPLDSNSKVPAANLPATATPTWGAINGSLNDQADLSTALAGKQATLGFTPENASKKGAPNGYAPLGSDSKVPAANLPPAVSLVWGGITGTLSDQSDLSTALAGKQPSLGYTAENAANKGAPSGYAPLGADSKVPAANLPSTATPTWGAITGTLSSQTDLVSALAAKQNSLGFTAENSANKGAANGYAPLGADSKVPAANLPASATPTWGAITGTLSSQTDLSAALSGKQSVLGFTPENVANKDTANGYVGLGAGGLLAFAEIPVGTGATQVAAGNDSRFLNATKLNGTSISAFAGLPWFTAGTPATATYSNIVSLFASCTSGYLKFDGSCSTPSGSTWGGITGTLANQTDLSTALSAKADSTDTRFLNATKLNGTSIATFAGLPFFTTGTPAAATYSNIVSLFTSCTVGYLKFDGTCSSPGAPAWGAITGTLTSQADLSTALAGKASTSDSRFLNATSLNGTSIAAFGGLPFFTAGVPATATSTNIVSLFASCTAGYLKFDGTCSSPSAPAWGAITGTLASQTDLSTAINAKADSTDARFLNATKLNGTSIATFAGIPWFTTGTPAAATSANIVSLFTTCTSGYLKFDGTCSLPTAVAWGNITGSLSSQTDLSTALAGKQASLGFTPENATNKGAANGYAPLDATSKVPAANLPAVVAPAWGAITGTLANQTDLNTALTAKADSTDARFLNATKLNGTTIATFGGLPWFTSGTPAVATSSNIISLFTTCTSGYLKFDGTCGTPTAVAWGNITGSLASQTDLSTALAGKQASLGFTPENAANKGAANGYAPLDATSKVPAANLPAVVAPAWGAITGTLANQADLNTALAGKQASLGFTAENSANKGTANGYAPLGADSKVPSANLPAITPPVWGNITGTLSNQTDLSTALAGKQASLGYTPENVANKGAANGYAGLDANSRVPVANIPLDAYTVGAGGATQNVIVANGVNPGEAITPAAGSCGFGVAQSTVAQGGSVFVKSAGLVQVMADGAIPLNHVVTCSSTNGGYITDTGATSTTRVSNLTPVVGIVTTASTGPGTLATIRWHGPGIFGTAVSRSFQASFTGSGLALTAGAVATTSVPYGCVINSYNITADSGGATFDIWKVASGSSMPTSANSIVGTANPVITGGTPVHSTTLTGWTTTVTANDIVTFQLKAITGTPGNASIQVICQ